MPGLAEGRVHAFQVADVAPLKHHGHVPGERAVVVPDGRSEFGMSLCECTQRIAHCLPALGFNRHRFGSDDSTEGCIQSDFHACILTPLVSGGNILIASMWTVILRETDALRNGDTAEFGYSTSVDPFPIR